MLKEAFTTAISDINNSEDYDFKFLPIIEIIGDNPYEAMNTTCTLLEKGVIAIFGPSLEDSSNVVQSITDAKEIPHIEVRWDDHPQNGTIVNIHPYPDVLTRTYLDIIEAWGWRDFVILYENNESLQRVGELLKMFNPSKHRIVVRQLKDEFRTVLKELWRSGATHFVLDCTTDILPEVLNKAQQVGLMTNKEHYIITNLDFHTLELTQYRYSETNITGMLFVDPDDKRLIKAAAKIYNMEEGMEFAAGWKLRLEEALLYDAVKMFAIAVKEAPQLKEYPVDVSCHNNQMFSEGTTIINYMKNFDYTGLTGRINKFDNEGFRKNFALDVIELMEGGITKVGVWNYSSHVQPLTITRIVNESTEDFSDIRNRTFIVAITLTPPYGMEKESTENLQGNDRYEGFAVDLIQALAAMRGFNYTIVVKDGKVGKFNNATGKYTGLIGDLHDRKIDLVVTDLTITYEREEAVDFTSPFMMLGISILYQKPTKAPPGFFSFADPFAFEVWRLLVLACVGVSFVLFVVGRISSSEWENPYPCIEEPEYLVNQLDLRNCAWFVTGSIMQQGSEIELKSVATRMVAGMWWFFTLLMVSSYTANLAAFLTTESPDPHFNNLRELVNNAEEKGIKYGAKLDGATANFIRDKADSDKDYAKAWEFIKKHDDVLVNETKDGVDRAATEKYAFFMESSSIEYEIQRRCNLNQVNGLLDEKGYGIAMRKNESYRNSLSTGILILQNSGKLEEIKRTWWEQRKGGGQCLDKSSDAEATSLNLVNVGGVFGVTIAGTILALFMAMLETVLHAGKKSVKTKTPFGTVLMQEIKFYFRFSEVVKPVYQGNSLGGSNQSHKFQSEEKELPYNLVNKQISVETLESYTNSHKSKGTKKELKPYSKQMSINTC
ncbi:glutamate receptor ionotropic, kainate 2-like isoform X2 [Anoplophora glabripennis]|nr:glutamate receptor ionotropic, kainate 2-like isoform X2 [Anoplophora glabripennis]